MSWVGPKGPSDRLCHSTSQLSEDQAEAQRGKGTYGGCTANRTEAEQSLEVGLWTPSAGPGPPTLRPLAPGGHLEGHEKRESSLHSPLDPRLRAPSSLKHAGGPG